MGERVIDPARIAEITEYVAGEHDRMRQGRELAGPAWVLLGAAQDLLTALAVCEANKEGFRETGGYYGRETTALKAEVARLREALERIAESYEWEPYAVNETVGVPSPHTPGFVLGWVPTNRRIARDALSALAKEVAS